MPGVWLSTITCPVRNLWLDHPVSLLSIEPFFPSTMPKSWCESKQSSSLPRTWWSAQHMDWWMTAYPNSSLVFPPLLVVCSLVDSVECEVSLEATFCLLSKSLDPRSQTLAWHSRDSPLGHPLVLLTYPIPCPMFCHPKFLVITKTDFLCSPLVILTDFPQVPLPLFMRLLCVLQEPFRRHLWLFSTGSICLCLSWGTCCSGHCRG